METVCIFINFATVMKTKIYVLKHPDTKEVRYVGKTIQKLKKRLSGHITKAKYSRSTHVSCWIHNLLQENKKPLIKLLEEVNNWQEREQYWITKFDNLCNHSIGGESGTLGYSPTQSHRDKIANKLIGRKRKEEVKKKISESHKGKKLKNSTKEKLKNVNLGKKYSRESRIKRGSKTVQQFDLNGNLIEEYFSLGNVSELTGFSKGNIGNCCNGIAKTAYGYIWKYKDEDIVHSS